MKVLFVEPPRRLWPYMNYEDNFLVKQSYLALAANLRANGFPDVHILDCMPLKMGWKSLAAELRTRQPDVVCVGENHALYANEALKLLRLAKAVLPHVVTVAGGAHFTHLADTYLGASPAGRSSPPPPWLAPGPPVADYVVKGEGDLTLVELLQAVADHKLPPTHVPGLAFVADGAVVHTAPRPLVADLDSLPLPAYDLVPMDRYGRASLLFSPGGTTIHHSRGCAHACKFCVWWTQMACRTLEPDGTEQLHPRWRTKSVERTVEEVELLAHKYRKQGLVFVDDCFNLDPRWNARFSQALVEHKLKCNWFAFVRADYLVRDHASGVLEQMARAGLSHVSIGVERAEDEKLTDFSKRNYSADITRQAFSILKQHHPQVFRQATFIVGLPDETRESMQRQLDFARALDLDYPGFHPLTPVPGTALWNEAITAGLIEARDFTEFDWATPVIRSRTLTRREIEESLIDLGKRYVTLPWVLRGLTSPGAYKRAMYRWFVKVSASMTLDLARNALLRPKGPLAPLVTPKWYDR